MKLVLILVVFLLIYLLAFLVNPLSENWAAYKTHSIWDLLEEFITGFLLVGAVIQSSIWISRMLDKKLSWTTLPFIRFLIQLVLVIIVVVSCLYLQDLYFVWKYGHQNFSIETGLDLWQYFVVSVIVSIFVSAVHTAYSFLEYWKLSMSETAELKIKTLELKEIAMQAELQSLKLQLDPHFMFNNFSTLSELINQDKQVASLFLDSLSQVYRYMILNLKKDTILLGEEIEFVKSYVYLMLIRHGENVQINISIPVAFSDRSVPPISLQLLIENAIKHNQATKNNPLIIEVYVDREKELLIVQNTLQRIPNPLYTTGLGLENIRNRYSILSGKTPVIRETEDHFIVELPLLD